MAVEINANTIADLNPNWPLPDDYISEGDDHLKIIKQTLQNTFTEVDEPLTAPLSKINDLDEFMDFSTTTVSGTEVKRITLQGVQVIGGLTATAQDGFITLQQLNQVVANAIQQGVYRVGSYYISDDSTNPRTVLGFGTWTRVAGFLAGAGTLAAGGGVDPLTIASGDSGGLHAYKLDKTMIPKLEGSVSGTTGKAGKHKHQAGNEGPMTDQSLGDHQVYSWGGSPQRMNGPWVTGEVDDHEHSFAGSVTLGTDSPATIQNMPPFTTTNIWKRIA